MDSKKTGVFISELRKELGLTQIALAEKLNVSNRAVSKWENGDGFPDVTTMPALAEALGVTVDELLAGEKANKKSENILFIIEGENRKQDLIDGYKVYINSRFSSFLMISTIILLAVMSVTVLLVDIANKALLLSFLLCYALFLISFKLILPKIGAKNLVQDDKLMHNDTDRIKIEFGNRIYVSSSFASQEIEYNAISKMLETKELIIAVFGVTRFLAFNKNELVKGDLDDFREFIKGKVVPNKKEIRMKKISTIAAIVAIAMSVALIPLDIVLYNINHANGEQYQISVIEDSAQLFYDNQKEFDRAINQIQSDEKIQKKVAEDEYFCYSSEEYIAISEILDVEVGNDYITFSTYYKDDCMSGYAYIESDKPIYPYQIGFDHADIENYGFNYIAEDDVYLLGKESNKSKASDWFLVKILDDNWYYYEYY